MTYIWAERGSRPRPPRDQRYDWAYIFAALCPARGIGVGLILPEVNTEAMNLHLAEISRHVAPGAHAVMLLDGAGWHQQGGRLVVPDNISLLLLPPYSPELNPVENDGSSSSRISSATGCSPDTRRSWMRAAMPGTRSWRRPSASAH